MSKSPTVRRHVALSPAESSGPVPSGPTARVPKSSSFDDDEEEDEDDDDGPEQQIRLEVERAIKQEDEEDPFAYSFSVREDDYDYGVAPDPEEESAVENEFEDSLPNLQSGHSAKGDVGDMDEPIQSIEVDDESSHKESASPSLRGGTSRTRRRDSSEEDGNDNHDGDKDDSDSDCLYPPTNLDDYYESDEEFQDEYDVDSESLDWYRLERTRMAGIRDWPKDAAHAHKLMSLCGFYSLFPNSWKCDLVDHPYLSGLFSPLKDKKTLIRAESNQFRVTRALRNLFELQIRICAYRKHDLRDKIADVISKEILRYNASIERDAKLLGYFAYSSPILVIKFPSLQFANVADDQLRDRVHAQAMQFCREGVENYLNRWAQRGIEHFPRVLFAFVIIQHTVQIWALDTEIPTHELNNPYPLRTIDMSRTNDWLNCTLAIAIPIHLAKDALCAHRWNFPAIDVEESDVDL